MTMGAFDNLAEHVEAATTKKFEPLRSLSVKDPFTTVTLPKLCSGRWDETVPPRARLYFYLCILSFRGTREVHMTNTAARSIHISRELKSRYLHELEAEGLIAVRRNGHEAPWVQVLELL
jgi:hypothetical protein